MDSGRRGLLQEFEETQDFGDDGNGSDIGSSDENDDHVSNGENDDDAMPVIMVTRTMKIMTTAEGLGLEIRMAT